MNNRTQKSRYWKNVCEIQEKQTQKGLSKYGQVLEETDAALNQLLLQQSRLKAELRRIDSTLSDNKRFRKFVAEMKLLVQSPEGMTFPVTEDNIVGLNDAIDLLITKRKFVSTEFASVSSKIENLEKIKKMDIHEMVEFLESKSGCKGCTYDRQACDQTYCKLGIKEWLEKEMDL